MSVDPSEIRRRIAAALGTEVVQLSPLSGGQVGEALRCRLEDGREVVAKTSPGTPLEVEAATLRYLKAHSTLPVPEVLHVEDGLMVQAFVEGSSAVGPGAERDAGRLLAELHQVRAERYGLERDTLIGPFPLDNTWTASWPQFYAARRLLPMAAEAHARGRLPTADRLRVERLAEALPKRFDADPTPSLIHGDVWSGNVLARGDRITAFLDPAIYYAHAEMELAFIDLFHTFGEAFYEAYESVRPIEQGYSRWRRDLYQVFPLLVHVALFGDSYLTGLRARLERLGA